MIYKRFLKLKKVIGLFILICIMVPLIGACSDAENNLKDNYVNSKIGYGSNIEAYTTYSQAKLIEMDKDMYYSYLLSGRDFILAVLPKDPNEDVPDKENYMFQAIYNGVTSYSQEIAENGNFKFSDPRYKILIYYITADKFLEWDEKATDKVEGSKSFVSKALDLLGPASNNYEHDVQNRLENYTLRNVVNVNSYISECYFLRTKNGKVAYNSSEYGSDWERISTKCGDNENRGNVIADVKNASDRKTAGVTLLYSGGGLNGYFTYEDVSKYNFENSPWIYNLLNNKYGGSISNMVDTLTSTLSESEKKAIFEDSGMTIETYAKQTEFKLKYDLSLFSRISKVNYNTLLDINTSTTDTTAIKTIDNASEYSEYIKGTTEANNGNYLAFTTADGFVYDRGDIFIQAAADAIFEMNVLEMFTNMDACTNRTIASYIAEVLATAGIALGGIATVAGGAAAVVSVLVATGAVSSSVPVVGWIVGAACLLAAGITALVISASTKKAIQETSSDNYCKIYQQALEDIIGNEYIKLPIYHYNVPSDGTETELCFSETVVDPKTDSTQCGYFDSNGKFVKKGSVPLFVNADKKIFNSLGDLSGAPSLRLYKDGKVVDEIYGVASTQFLISILDSWGVTASNNMKYYAQVEDKASTIKTITIYDLLRESEDKAEISKGYYCISEKYGKSCSIQERAPIYNISSLNTNGSFKFDTASYLHTGFAQEKEKELKKNHKISMSDYKEKLKKNVEAEYSKIVQEVTLENSMYYVKLHNSEDKKYRIDIDNENKQGNLIDSYGNTIALTYVEDGGYYTFEYSGSTYKLSRDLDKETNEFITYKVSLMGYGLDDASPFTNTINKLKNETKNADALNSEFVAIVNRLVQEMEESTDLNTIKDHIDTLINGLRGQVYYSELVDAYINITLVDKDGNEYTVSNIYSKNMKINLQID